MKIRTEIEVAAPPERVWEVLVDFPGYAAWNPFMVSIEGKAEVGEKITIEIAPPNMRRRKLRERVRAVTPYAELRWGAGLPIPGLLDGDHFFQLVKHGDRTRVLHGEDFTGLVVPLIKGMLANIEKGFALTNEALKRRVEG
jgi:hypothetical protein